MSIVMPAQLRFNLPPHQHSGRQMCLKNYPNG